MDVQASFLLPVDGGLKLFIREWGQQGNSNTTVVLIHGLAEGSFVWNDFAMELAPFFHVLAIDLRGHGDSEHDPKLNYTFERYVSDVEEILNQLKLDHYLLIGHSLGASIAARITINNPKRVKGSLWVDSGPWSNTASREYLHGRILESHRTYDSPRAYADWLAERRFLASKRTVDRLANSALIHKAGLGYQQKFDLAVADILLQKVDSDWWWDGLPNIDSPVLILRGVGSAVLPALICDRMIKLLRNGKASVIQFAGHSVMNDNPREFASEALKFMLPLID